MKNIQLYFAYIEGHKDFIAFGLDEKETIYIAENSFWADELDGDISVICKETLVYEFNAELDYTPGATNHVNWKCPICDSWQSEDYYEEMKSPIIVSCGNSKKHPDNNDAWILVDWKILNDNKSFKGTA